MKRAFPKRRKFSARFGSLPYCKKVKTTFEDNLIKVLDWPGSLLSPNPIENLWSILKIRLLKRDCTSKTKLIDAIIDVWCCNLEITQKSKTENSKIVAIFKQFRSHIATTLLFSATARFSTLAPVILKKLGVNC